MTLKVVMPAKNWQIDFYGWAFFLYGPHGTLMVITFALQQNPDFCI